MQSCGQKDRAAVEAIIIESVCVMSRSCGELNGEVEAIVVMVKSLNTS